MRRGLFIFLLVALALPGQVWAKDSEAIPFLKKVPACNPALGGDCTQAAVAEDKCSADSDCKLGCAKGDDGDAISRCLPLAKAGQCTGGDATPIKGVSCGCMPDSHSCGFLPLPVK